MKTLDINNQTPRTIVCNNIPSTNIIMGYFTNKEKLTPGKEYHMTKMVVGNWKTEVYLAEFPGIAFNSTMFAENENNRFTALRETITANGRSIKCIAVMSGRSLPRLKMSNYSVDLFQLQERISQMNEGDCIVFGRSKEDCDIIVSEADRTVSRIHCMLRKEGKELRLYDCSLNGTSIVF